MLNFSKTRIVKKGLTIKGWTSKEKLGFLYDMVKQTDDIQGDILEIGSAWGRSTVVMGLTTEKTIYSIDPHTGGLAYINKNENQGSYEEFVSNLRNYDIENRVIPLKATTSEVIESGELTKKVFSLIFIDGLHTAEGVEIDFGFSFPRLASGGVIVFDDYFESSVADMKKKIDELFESIPQKLIKNEKVGLAYAFKD